MTVDFLEKELKQNNLQSLYLLYGEEKYLLENAVKKIKKIFKGRSHGRALPRGVGARAHGITP